MAKRARQPKVRKTREVRGLERRLRPKVAKGDTVGIGEAEPREAVVVDEPFVVARTVDPDEWMVPVRWADEPDGIVVTYSTRLVWPSE